VESPKVHYTRSGDTTIAYSVVGDGPIDIVFIVGWFISTLEYAWEGPPRQFFERLASFSRLIIFDKRGTGLSDRMHGIPDHETRMDDVRAVMDAVGSERAAIMGVSEGGPLTALFAATYPERTAAAIFYGTGASYVKAHDYPWATDRDEVVAFLDKYAYERWGSDEWCEDRMKAFAPSTPYTEELKSWWGRYVRLSASPGAAVALSRANLDLDVRSVLPTIRVPTLVAHVEHEQIFPLDAARYIADHVPGAELVVIPGDAHAWFIEPERVTNEVERFLMGIYERGEWNEVERDRVLATILFTDIVGSTAHAAELGDRGWRELLTEHHSRVRRQLARYRGEEIDTAGDGFFASFDGPARAIRCASAIGESVRDLGLEVRAGVHTGECEVVDGKVGGIAVHIGARVAAEARPGEVLVSQTVRDLVSGSGLTFSDRGAAELKGVPGEWRLFALA
jgi:pimeloyl-ACP methyl ester carboxylesterase